METPEKMSIEKQKKFYENVTFGGKELLRTDFDVLTDSIVDRTDIFVCYYKINRENIIPFLEWQLCKNSEGKLRIPNYKFKKSSGAQKQKSIITQANEKLSKPLFGEI